MCGCTKTMSPTYQNRTALFRGFFPHGGAIVEVGSQKGVSALQILRGCSPRLLILIDPWRFVPGTYEQDPANRPTERREAEMRECAQRVGSHPNVAMLRMMSQEAAGLFRDGSLDAVYIDADHSADAVRADLERWYPKVRQGGVVSGHDYTAKLPWVEVRGVVDEWVAARGLDLVTTAEVDVPHVPRPCDDVDGAVFASWAFRKP